MRKFLLLAGFVVASAVGTAAAEDKQALVAEGKALIKEFAGTLKGELMAAVEAGGPVNAIGVCNARAPEIERLERAEIVVDAALQDGLNRRTD